MINLWTMYPGRLVTTHKCREWKDQKEWMSVLPIHALHGKIRRKLRLKLLKAKLGEEVFIEIYPRSYRTLSLSKKLVYIPILHARMGAYPWTS